MHFKIMHLLFLIFFKSIVLQNCNGFALSETMNPAMLMKYFSPIPFLDDITVTEVATFQQILSRNPQPIIEDRYLNLYQLTRKYGYNLEEHFVTTEDGYILRIHRLPSRGPPVLLMHGILLSSDDFFIAGPNHALAYQLSNEGYDVWIGNFRGNKYSRNHTTISPDTDSARFFDFTWDEMGRHDLPTTIDYVLATTNRMRLSYVGFSQGNTAFYVMGSVLPEYNRKISVMISLSPIAFVPNAKSPIVRFMAFNHISEILSAIGIKEFLPYSPLVRTAFGILCANENLALAACSNLAYVLFGFDRGELNVTNLPVILSHAPAGCSTKQVTHYLQLVVSGYFRNFDYGSKNLEVYGSPVPPDYPLDNISAPIALLYSDTDYFSNMTDVMTLQSKLPNVVGSYFVESFSHVSFLWGRHIRDRINSRVLELIESFL